MVPVYSVKHSLLSSPPRTESPRSTPRSAAVSSAESPPSGSHQLGRVGCAVVVGVDLGPVRGEREFFAYVLPSTAITSASAGEPADAQLEGALEGRRRGFRRPAAELMPVTPSGSVVGGERDLDARWSRRAPSWPRPEPPRLSRRSRRPLPSQQPERHPGPARARRERPGSAAVAGRERSRVQPSHTRSWPPRRRPAQRHAHGTGHGGYRLAARHRRSRRACRWPRAGRPGRRSRPRRGPGRRRPRRAPGRPRP